MYVQNLKSPRSGRAVANQFVMYGVNTKGEHIVCFQSYDSLVAVKNISSHTVTIHEKYVHYSRTTSRYLRVFLDEYCYCADKIEYINEDLDV